MRIRTLLAAASAVAVLAPASPVSATPASEASTYGVIVPEGAYARVDMLCVGQTDPTAVSTQITCEVYDSSGIAASQIIRRRVFPGPVCVCAVHVYAMEMPITYCSTVVATFPDATTSTDRVCKTFGSPGPPQNPPAHSPRILECLDPTGSV